MATWTQKPPRGDILNTADAAYAGMKVCIHCFPDAPPVDLISGTSLTLNGSSVTFDKTYDTGVMSNCTDANYYTFTDTLGVCDPGNNSFAWQWDGFPLKADMDRHPSGVGANAVARDFGAGVASWHMQTVGLLGDGTAVCQVEAEFPNGSDYAVCYSGTAGGSGPLDDVNGGPFTRVGFRVPTGVGGTPAFYINGSAYATTLINSSGGALGSWQGVKASAQNLLTFGTFHPYARDGYFMAGYFSRFIFWSPAPTVAIMQDIGSTSTALAFRYMKENINTRNRRASCLSIRQPNRMRVFPNPDGSLANQADRQVMAYMYSGILAGGAAIVSWVNGLTTSIRLTGAGSA